MSPTGEAIVPQCGVFDLEEAGTCPLVGVVILNWNGWRDTLEAVTSARRSCYGRLRLYVVDNASTDGSESRLRNAGSDVVVLQAGANLGWAGGNNVGIRRAISEGCKHVLLLNNDARLQPESIGALVGAAETLADVACLGSLIVRWGDPGWVEFGGSFVEERTGLPSQIHGHASVLDLAEAPRRVVAVKGCSMLLTGLGLARVGLLSEDYFLNYDETDWCYRAARAGLGSWLVPLSIVEHKGAVSFGGTEGPLYRYFTTRNRLVFARRHLGLRGRWHAWKSAFWDLRQALFAPRPAGIEKSRSPGRVAMAWVVLIASADHCRSRLGDCPAFVRKLNATTQKG